MSETVAKTHFDMSLLMPGIRTDLWERVYEGLQSSTTQLTTEVVFVGPYDLPESLREKPDVQFIRDWGHANRCAQISLMHARGERVLLASDDGYLLPNMIDHLYDTLDELGERQPNHIAVGKYIEGEGTDMEEDWYYYLNNHDFTSPGIQDDWLLGCYLLLDREYFLEEFGGFNMLFEGSAMACHELAIRIQKFGDARLVLSKKQIAKCDHMPGTSGDHGPMHYAQILHDQPLYRQMIPLLGEEHKKVDCHAWKDCEAVWNRRFQENLKATYEFVDSNWICTYEQL